MKKMILRERDFAWLIVLAGAIVNLVTIKDGHNWGGDFSQYILHAGNILHGRTYTAGIMLDPVIVYPPGFPLLLLPLLALMGVDFIAFKVLNVVLWSGAVMCIVRMMEHQFGSRVAIFTAVFLSFSGWFFVFKQNVLSDVPFFFLVCLSLYLWQRCQESAQRSRVIFVTLAMVAAFLTRSAGVTLFVAALIHAVITRKDRITIGIIVTGVMVSIFLQVWIMGGVYPGFLKAFVADGSNVVQRLMKNAFIPWEAFGYLIIPKAFVLKTGMSFVYKLAGILLAVISCAGIATDLFRGFAVRRIPFLTIFSLSYLACVTLWSVTYEMPAEGFSRMMLPLFPLLFVVAGRMAQQHKKVFYCLLSGIIAINILGIFLERDFNDDVFYDPNDASGLLHTVRTMLSEDEHFMFWEPRPVTLMTGRVGTSTAWLANNPQDVWPQILKQLGVRYFIAIRGLDDERCERFMRYVTGSRVVWQDSKYSVILVADE